MKKINILFLFLVLLAPIIFSEEARVKIFSSFSEAVPVAEGPILLVFFSTDCYVCWKDLLEMKYFIEKNNLPVQIVGISKDSKKELEPFLAKFSFFYPVICDRKGKLYKRFKVDLEPFRIVLFNDKILCKDSYYEDLSLREEKIKRCLLKVILRQSIWLLGKK